MRGKKYGQVKESGGRDVEEPLALTNVQTLAEGQVVEQVTTINSNI